MMSLTQNRKKSEHYRIVKYILSQIVLYKILTSLQYIKRYPIYGSGILNLNVFLPKF